MLSRSRGKTYNVSNRRLNTGLQYLYKMYLAAQAQARLPAAAATTASGKPRLGWAVCAQLNGSLRPQPLLLPCSLLSSIPNGRASFISPILFPPYTQHSSQTELCLSSPLGPVGSPSPEWQSWGGKMKGEGGLLYEGRLLHGWELLPTWRVCEHACVCRLQPPTRTGGGILKSISSSCRHHSQAALFWGNI